MHSALPSVSKTARARAAAPRISVLQDNTIKTAIADPDFRVYVSSVYPVA